MKRLEILCHGLQMAWISPPIDFRKRPFQRFSSNDYPVILFHLKNDLWLASGDCNLMDAISLQMWTDASPFKTSNKYWTTCGQVPIREKMGSRVERGFVPLAGDKNGTTGGWEDDGMVGSHFHGGGTIVKKSSLGQRLVWYSPSENHNGYEADKVEFLGSSQWERTLQNLISAKRSACRSSFKYVTYYYFCQTKHPNVETQSSDSE